MSQSIKCSNPKAIKQLIKAYKKTQIFSKNLKTNLFLVIVEILKNSVLDTFTNCFSLKTKHLLQKHKKIFKKITSSSIARKNRKTLFLKVKQKIKKTVMNVICDFIKNCLEDC